MYTSNTRLTRIYSAHVQLYTRISKDRAGFYFQRKILLAYQNKMSNSSSIFLFSLSIGLLASSPDHCTQHSLSRIKFLTPPPLSQQTSRRYHNPKSGRISGVIYSRYTHLEKGPRLTKAITFTCSQDLQGWGHGVRGVSRGRVWELVLLLLKLGLAQVCINGA